jgi:hypothetical protein
MSWAPRCFMGKAQIEASVPGGIWGDNATFEARGLGERMWIGGWVAVARD